MRKLNKRLEVNFVNKATFFAPAGTEIMDEGNALIVVDDKNVWVFPRENIISLKYAKEDVAGLL